MNESVIKLPRLHSPNLQYISVPYKNTLVVPITVTVLFSIIFSKSVTNFDNSGSIDKITFSLSI